MVYGWVMEFLPAAEAHGWKIEIDPPPPPPPPPPPTASSAAIDDWYSETLASTENDHDWFSYELGVVIEERNVNLLPFLGNIFALPQEKRGHRQNVREDHLQTPGRPHSLNSPPSASVPSPPPSPSFFDSDNLKNGRL